jgi:5'-nucleotidase
MLDGNGKQFDLNKTYRVITSNYLVDSTAEFKGAKKVADVGIDTDLFVDYFKDQTAAGKLILAPELNRKFYLTKPQLDELLNKLKQETQVSKQGTTNNDLDEKNSQTSDQTDKLVNKADEPKTSEQEQAKKSEESTKIIYVVSKAKKEENTLKVVNEPVGKNSSFATLTRSKSINRNESKKVSLPKAGAEDVSWISWLGLALTSLFSFLGLGIKKRN